MVTSMAAARQQLSSAGVLQRGCVQWRGHSIYGAGVRGEQLSRCVFAGQKKCLQDETSQEEADLVYYRGYLFPATLIIR